MTHRIEERRLVTILFADLSGFTKLSHSLEPEEVRDVANVCFEYLNPPIIKYGGVIHKYEGDLVIALFGLPVAHEDDPERAIKASLEMMSLVSKMNETLSSRLKIKTELGLHIGINSGIIAVGEVGSKEKKEYTIMGEAVNFASRLKDTAKRGEILVSEAVFRASRYLFEYESLPPVSIKGIVSKVSVFKPLRIKDKPDPKRGIQGLYSPMVGRDQEFKLLKEWVEGLKDKRFGAGFILGDAGLGKSRLWEELKKHFSTRSPLLATILESRCLSYSDTMPYFPFVQIIGKISGIEDRDSPEIVKEKLLRMTEVLFFDDYKEVLPYLGYLFSIRFTDELDEKIKYLEPKDLKIQIFLSVRRLLSRLSRTQPVLLAIDDFHWIDPVSLELIEFIFDAPEPFPLFFLGISRVEKKPYYKIKERLRKRLGDDYLEIILRPLDINFSTQLANNLLKMPDFPEEFRNKILSKAEGNPFCLEEIIRSFIDSGILVFEDGVWKLTTCSSLLSTLKIPDTVQAVIASRLDKLDKDTQGVLQIASVIGRSFHFSILKNISELDEVMLSLHLATLEEFEYINKLRTEPELEYIFRHPLIQEVVYNGLLKKRRRELHHRIGEAMENVFHNRLEDFCEILAHQYSNSDNFEKAIEWLKRAGKKAMERFANDEAIGNFKKVITIIKENNLIPIHQGSRIESLEALGDIYSLKGEYEDAMKNYEEMVGSADNIIIQARARRKIADIYKNQSRLDDSLKILESAQKVLTSDSNDEIIEKSEIYILISWILRIKGEMERAIKEGEKGLQLIEKAGIDEKKMKLVKAKGFNNLGVIFWNKGEYDKAIEFYEKCLRICEGIGYKQGIGAASGNLGIIYKNKGEYDRAIEFYEKYLRISEEIGYKYGIGAASGNLGIIYRIKGEYDRAIEFYEKNLRIREEIGDKQGIGKACSNLGNVHMEKGEYDRAIELHQKYLRISEEIGYKRGIGIASFILGNIYLEIGRLKESEEYLLKSKKILEEIRDKYHLIETYCIFPELLIKKEEGFEKAIEYVDKALKLAEELDSRERKAICYFTYGKIYSSIGDFKYSGECFKKAIDIYKELKMIKSLADCYLEYAKMLKNAWGIQGLPPADEYFNKALEIYQEFKLTHGIKEILSLRHSEPNKESQQNL